MVTVECIGWFDAEEITLKEINLRIDTGNLQNHL